MNKNLVSEGKTFINNHNIDGLSSHYGYMKELNQTNEYNCNDQYIFQQLFTHACLKKKKNIIIFLIRLYFEIFDEFTQIALKHSFVYAKYTIKNDKSLFNWYDKHIIPLIK